MSDNRYDWSEHVSLYKEHPKYWSKFEKTNGPVAQHMKWVLGKTDSQMLEPYTLDEDDEPEVARQRRETAIAWATPAEDQPVDNRMWARLFLLSDAYLTHNLNNQWFYESMEGDYCNWHIHLADKILNRVPLTPGDWVLIRFISDITFHEQDFTREEAKDNKQLEVLRTTKTKDILEIAKKYENADCIFNSILC